MNFFITLFFLVVIIGILVFVHELGHFLAAKLSGVHVEEFAIGFGKNIFAKTYKDTKYSINLFPFGGFVQLEGENQDLGPNSFRNKRFRVKAFVLLAGVIMNLILSVVLLGFYLASTGYRFVVPDLVGYEFTATDFQGSYFPLTITFIDKDGPSFGKLDLGENIVEINNIRFRSMQEFLDILKDNQDKDVKFTFLNFQDFSVYEKNFKISTANENGSILRVGLSQYDSQSSKSIYFIKYKESIIASTVMTYDFFIYQFKALGGILGNAFSSGDYTEVSNNVGGLPSIGNQINQAVEFQAYDILVPLTALFSVNLAMLNILPFPALDGGQLFIAFIERVTKRKIPDNILNTINLVGFTFLMLLGLLVTLKDIVQLNWVGNLLAFFRNVTGK